VVVARKQVCACSGARNDAISRLIPTFALRLRMIVTIRLSRARDALTLLLSQPSALAFPAHRSFHFSKAQQKHEEH